MTRKYNPGLFPALIAEWRAEEEAKAAVLVPVAEKPKKEPFHEKVCRTFNADMTREEFYHELLFWMGLALVSGPLAVLLTAVL